MNAIIANRLFKSFEKGKVKALEDISFEVKQSELFGLIGPDGAGKTTLMNVVSGFITARSGRVVVDGQDFLPLAHVGNLFRERRVVVRAITDLEHLAGRIGANEVRG